MEFDFFAGRKDNNSAVRTQGTISLSFIVTQTNQRRYPSSDAFFYVI